MMVTTKELTQEVIKADNATALTQAAKIEHVAIFEHGYGADKLGTHTNPAVMYLASLGSIESQKTMRRVLDKMAKYSGFNNLHEVPWSTITRSGLFKLMAILSKKGLSASTRNLYLSAVKGVSREAFIAKQLDADEYQMIKLIKSSSSKPLPRGRALPIDEVTKLMDHCLGFEGPAGIRDAALLSVFFGCGPRRSEIVSIDLSDINWPENSIRITGKGEKIRELEMPKKTKQLLTLWMKERGGWHGPLFVGINRWHKLGTKRLDARSAYKILEKRVAQAGMEKVSPHDLRRSFITYLLDIDIDIATVADMAGHSSIDTTRIYDRRQKERNRKAANKMDF